MSNNNTNNSDQNAKSEEEIIENLRQLLSQKLIESGEEEKLKEYVSRQLIDCGWKDQTTQQCKEIINKKGMDLTVEDLIGEVSGPAIDQIPSALRDDLLVKLKDLLILQSEEIKEAAAK